MFIVYTVYKKKLQKKIELLYDFNVRSIGFIY